jgi:signal transduction histidine kinase
VFTADAATYPVSGSPELLVQLLDKLVDNAVDFSGHDDEIVVAIRRDDKDVVLSVTNPGPPLPDSLRHRIFQSMVSVRATGGEDNLGLGLHIARIIAEGHRGTIEASNTRDGVRFELRLGLS